MFMETNSETQSLSVNAPIPFSGDLEQRLANRDTHYFDPEYNRCINCDCRPWGEVANYPCGESVPRADVNGDQWEKFVAKARIHAAISAL